MADKLPDTTIQQIHAGLIIPNQETVIHMAREILAARGYKNPDLI